MEINQWVRANLNPAALGLIGFVVWLIFQYLLSRGVLRLIGNDDRIKRLVKHKYQHTVRLWYASISLLCGLAGVAVFVIALWFWPSGEATKSLPPFQKWPSHLLLFVLVMFLASAYIYVAGLAKATIEAFRDALDHGPVGKD